MDDLRQIIDEKLRLNLACRTEMLSLIYSGEAIAFVGAGMGVPLKYPSWDNLLNDLDGEARKLGPLTVPPEIVADPLKRADAIRAHFNAYGSIPLYHELLGRKFAPRTTGDNCTPAHRLLAGLPFRAFATTNYESSIESALRAVTPGTCPDHGITVKMDGKARHRVSAFLRSITDGNGGPRYVAHLHGRHDDPENMILTGTDYERAYGIAAATSTSANGTTATLHRMLTWALFATRRIIFVGCSMNDPYIKALLDAVQLDLWERSEQNHFVVLGLGPEDAKSADITAASFKRYGLQVVYYDNTDRKHTGLDQLLNEAAARCAASRQAPKADSPPAATSAVAATPVGAATTPTSSSAAWLDEVNERNASKPDPE